MGNSILIYCTVVKLCLLMCCQSVSVMLVFIIHQKVSRQWYVMWLTLTYLSLFLCSSAMLPDPHGIPFLSAKTMWLDCKSLARSVGIQAKGSVLGQRPKMPHNANPNCAVRGFMLLHWPCWSYHCESSLRAFSTALEFGKCVETQAEAWTIIYIDII